ncbi:MAG TPA: plastocyanin/azurin family copper-binding protein [Longimicrobium sp.]|nr:plastocyanin/azurin family copper-binding protein [Longimicrobium sp.]
MHARNPLRHATLAAAVALAACGGGDRPRGGQARTDTTLPAGTPAPSTTAAPAISGPTALGRNVAPGGRTIEIRMVTDESGNRFDPDTVRARERDVLRFTMVTGVHNVDFLAARNPGVRGLPGPSELFQQPGQSKEYVVGLKTGSYYFQCDPHAALGMTGALIVE